MKNKTLFFVAILSLSTIFFSCNSKSGDKVVSDLKKENYTLAEANKNYLTMIDEMDKKINALENEKNKPKVIGTANFVYQWQGDADARKFYKIILVTTISDPIITGGVEGEDAGEIIEFILESIEIDPVRVIGSEFYPYKNGKSSIPSNLKSGVQVTLEQLEYRVEGEGH
jgi:hypothetical protein